MMKTHTFILIVSMVICLNAPDLYSQNLDEQPTRMIRIETTLGNMVIELYNETPIHRDNMIKLIEEEYFTGQIFHRIIANFMIQGGDPHSVGAEKGQRLGSGGPGYTIPAEFNENLIHKKGALAAARQGDQMNPEKNSSGSQFYLVQGRVFTLEELNLMAQRGMINLSNKAIETYTTLGGTPHLDGSYTVFGEVVEGLDVLDRIASVETDSYDRPITDILFSISILR